MQKILILSVGGSSEPIVNAIKSYKPEFVYFFCSSGPKGSAVRIDSSGDPCGDKRRAKCPECGHEFHLGNPKGKSIVVQTGLKEDQYEIITIDDPDDLNKCYSQLVALARSIEEKHPGAQVIANYTGGTKTMSVAMALVGTMTEEWDLSLNKGPRLDIIKIRAGDTPVIVNKWQIFAEQRLESVAEALRKYDYALAEEIVSQLLFHPLEPGFQKRLLRIRQVCEAFNGWDKFDHRKALDLLTPYGKDFSSYIVILKKILKRTKSAGYELVADLFNNAERRAVQKHYDDAVARLYRATELFAQLRLEKMRGCKLGQVNLEELPEHLRPEYSKYAKEEGKLLLGLREDYELLHKLQDPVGIAFKENEGKILGALTYRNLSIYAHGITPLEEKDYKLVSDRLKGFVQKAARKIQVDLKIEQLPRDEILGR